MKIRLATCPNCGSKDIGYMRSLTTTPMRKNYICHECLWCAKQSIFKPIARWHWNHQKGVADGNEKQRG